MLGIPRAPERSKAMAVTVRTPELLMRILEAEGSEARGLRL